MRKREFAPVQHDYITGFWWGKYVISMTETHRVAFIDCLFKMISSLIKLPFCILLSKMIRNEHLQRKLNPLDLAWSVVRLHKWGISLQS